MTCTQADIHRITNPVDISYKVTFYTCTLGGQCMSSGYIIGYSALIKTSSWKFFTGVCEGPGGIKVLR